MHSPEVSLLGCREGQNEAGGANRKKFQNLLLFSLCSVSLRLSNSCTSLSHCDWQNPHEIVLASLKPADSELTVGPKCIYGRRAPMVAFGCFSLNLDSAPQWLLLFPAPGSSPVTHLRGVCKDAGVNVGRAHRGAWYQGSSPVSAGAAVRPAVIILCPCFTGNGGHFFSSFQTHYRLYIMLQFSVYTLPPPPLHLSPK